MRHFLRGSVALLLMLIASPYTVQALTEPCGQPSLTTGGTGAAFTTYDNVEYSPEGYLVYHFRNLPVFSSGGSFRVQWHFVNDECSTAGVGPDTAFNPWSPFMSLPNGVSDWSVRLVSSTTMEVWDDQNNAPIASFTIPEYPRYTRISFQGAGATNFPSSFSSRTVRLFENGGEPPILAVGAAPSPACPPQQVAGSHFDSYERAEYIDGLLRLHLRFKTPLNIGFQFNSRMFILDENCENATPVTPFIMNNTNLTPHMRYYSIRFMTSTQWEIWNDETNEKIQCPGCEGEIPDGAPFVMFEASLNSASASYHVTNPFPPVRCRENCFSNVLFLPGIKGSVLKSGADTLWPPTVWSDDVPQLALDETGNSVNLIHVNGVLNEFCVIAFCTPLYAPFSEFMDGLVTEGLINEWLPLAYDWRYMPEKILDEGIETSDGTLDVLEKIEELAANSKSGKVTIVGHSMGGLMGKAIIKRLQEEGKDDLIDSFVMVGSPQTGTPQAIAAILHGDDEGIMPGFILRANTARSLAQNLPSAYSLLPSSRYFDDVADPVIVFDANASFVAPWITQWGSFINLYSDFFDFATGQGVARTDPPENLLRVPEVLNPALLASAADFHSEYDTYEFPAHIRVVQVAGWGRPTTKTVEYREDHGVESYETLFTREGDNTVVYPSAISSTADETYYFNLFSHNKSLGSNAQHRNLLNTTPVQSLVWTVIRNESNNQSDFLFETKPTVEDIEDELLIGTHSPVILGAYDAFDNFTGIDPNQDLSGDVLTIQEKIPGSSFLYTSESQHIFLPKEGTYTLVYKGIGEGPTTVTIDNFSDDSASQLVQYSDIPTTANTHATFELVANTPEETAIEVDVNGDTVVDEIVQPDGSEPSLTDLLSFIKEKILTLAIKDKLKQNLLKKIANLEKKIEAKKEQNAKTLANFKEKVSIQGIKGKIASADADEIIALLELLEAQSDTTALDAEVLSALKIKIESLTIKTNLKKDLLKRVERLENKRALTNSLTGLTKSITNKGTNGTIPDADAQALLDLLEQIESTL